MKKKRLWAVTLAVSLAFGNVSWAEIRMPELSSGGSSWKEEVSLSDREKYASPSDAWHTASMANAEIAAKTDVQEFTANLEFRGTAYVGSDAEIYVILDQKPQKDQYIGMKVVVTEPSGNVVTQNVVFTQFYWEDELIYNRTWKEEGIYKFAIYNSETMVSNELEVLVTRQDYRVTLRAMESSYEFGQSMFLMADLDRITSENVEFYLEEKRPDSEFRQITEVEIWGYNGDSKKIRIQENGILRERMPGIYQYRLVDENGKTVSDTVSITIGKIKKLLVKPTKVVFEKTYGIPELDYYAALSQAYRHEFTAVNPTTGQPYTGDLTRIYLTREQGEEPGKYKLISAYSNECESIQFEGEFAEFVINKKKFMATTERELNVLADGKEHEIDAANIFFLYEHNKELPDSAEILKLSEADSARFVELKTSGSRISFTLKPTAESFTVEIPLSLVGKYVEFPEMKVQLKVNCLEYVEERTEEEIRQFKKEHPFSKRDDSYEESPSISKEIAGKLSADSRENILNAFNFYRYMAGIPADVKYDEELEYYAQAGTTLLTEVGDMTHTPDKPSGVSEAFYKDGYKGTSSSNLGMGFSSLVHALKDGWMNDGDASNIAAVGHRTWCLNPKMAKTGFGHSGQYTSMYAFDESREDISNPVYIPWPAQTMPIEYFSGPWSVMLENFEYYEGIEDEEDITVTLKCDGKTYTMTAADKDIEGKYMSAMYGHIVFQPGVRFRAGSEVDVLINGVKNRYGENADISYTVKFFSLGGSSGGGDSSSGGGGGSSSGGGGGGSTAGGPGAGGSKAGMSFGNAVLPDYVIRGNWTNTADGNWKFVDSTGVSYINKWAAVENPYANAALGQQAFDWFFFDGVGNMVTGWYQDADGNMYYLNTASDGTRGKMITGWAWIPDQNGVKKCYYFNPNSDGFRGKMMTNTVIDENILNTNGEWTVNGVVQTQ